MRCGWSWHRGALRSRWSNPGCDSVANLATGHDVGHAYARWSCTESLALYAQPLRRMREVMAGAAARAIPADAVAQVVARALTASRP